jgi:hypothetical protein
MTGITTFMQNYKRQAKRFSDYMIHGRKNKKKKIK